MEYKLSFEDQCECLDLESLDAHRFLPSFSYNRPGFVASSIRGLIIEISLLPVLPEQPTLYRER